MKKLFLLTLVAAFTTVQAKAQCESKPKATNISQDSKQNIVEIAAGTDDFSTLVAAVTAADLAETLSGAGPFTVFAPTNAAFNKLPEGTVGTLLKPENKATLQTILTYHVIAEDLMASDVLAAIKKNNGKVTLTTVSGGKITAMLEDGSVKLRDAKGNIATVVATDVDASNGVIHVIDTVVMPE